MRRVVKMHPVVKQQPLVDFTFSPIPESSSPDEALVAKTTIPTNIHIDLIREKQIGDPHIGLNERNVQWVHDRDWVYETSFELDPDWDESVFSGKAVAEIVFAGLDTFTSISINGKELLRTDNMFLEYRLKLEPESLKRGATNSLEILFESPMRVGNKLMEDNGGQRVTWNGHYCRNFVRKAQYHFGWDWGPSLVTSGPYKPINIVYSVARISSTRLVPNFRSSTDLSHVELAFNASVKLLDSNAAPDYSLVIALESPRGLTLEATSTLSSTKTASGELQFQGTLSIDNPELWYPRNYGPQNLYKVTYTLKYTPGNQIVHTKTHTTGFRQIELVQEHVPVIPSNALSGGRTFYFRINHVPVFIGGSNWIPADSFLPNITTERLEIMIKSLAGDIGNQNMLRVWGGGIYESDEFYDICDRNGIMVWQDVCLACGDYPANLESWSKKIQEELRYQLTGRGLIDRPSLVIWAGSNEDYQVADEELGYDRREMPDESKDGENWKNGSFPSRWLYERVFPRIVGEEYGVGWAGVGGFNGEGNEEADGEGQGRILYWPGSPWGGEDSTDRTIGDVHQWNVWGGIGAPYQRYPDLGGRFNSEFGMTSFPNIGQITSTYLPASPLPLAEAVHSPDFHPQSAASEHHQRAHSFEKRMMAYLGENFRVNFNNYKGYVYLSQLLQSEAMGYAYRGWRRRWHASLTEDATIITHTEGEDNHRLCGGILVWQLNDVWPVTSWSLVPHNLQPKPALYTISRALAPITIAVSRVITPDPKPNSKLEALVHNKTVRKAMKSGGFALHSTPHVYPPRNSKVTVWASSIVPGRGDELYDVEVRYVDIHTGDCQTVLESKGTRISPNSTTLLYEDSFSEDYPSHRLIHARLFRSGTKEVVSREADWPQPFKHYDYTSRTPKVDLSITDDGILRATLTTKRPIKALVLDFDEAINNEASPENLGNKLIWSDNCLDLVPGDEQVVYARSLLGLEIQQKLVEKARELEGYGVIWRYYGMEDR